MSCCRRGIRLLWSSMHWSTPSVRPGASLPGWVPATRCAPRWDIRCTVTNSRPTSRRLQARCGWAIGWRKDAFWGRDALLAEKEAGPKRLLRGLKAVGRGVLRPDLTVLDGDTEIGLTTSGTFSPTLKVGIALALIDAGAGIADGQTVSVDVRGRGLECEVVKPPFVEAKTR